MSCPEALDLVTRLENEMQPEHVLQRKAARELLLWAFPIFPNLPAYEQERDSAAAHKLARSIRPRAEHLAAGEPDPVTDVVHTLTAARDKLNEDEPLGFGAALADLRHWRGPSATGCQTYLGQADSDCRIAQDALNDLAALYGLYQNLVGECHADLVSILRAGVNAFEQIDQQTFPVVLTTASMVLGPLTAGKNAAVLILVGLSGIGSGLVSNIGVNTSSDLDTLRDTVNALDILKNNMELRVVQIQNTLVELIEKVNLTTADVRNKMPGFAKPGQGFEPDSFRPDTLPPDHGPISKDPLVPEFSGPGTGIARRLDPG